MTRGTDIDSAALRLIRTAIEEDVGSGDVTTQSVVPEEHISSGAIVANEEGVIAGIGIARAVFAEISPDLSFNALVRDGERVAPGAFSTASNWIV